MKLRALALSSSLIFEKPDWLRAEMTDKTTSVNEAGQSYRAEAQKPLTWAPLRKAMEARRLSEAVFYLSQRDCDAISTRATELALELIKRPCGMTQTDRIAFNLLLTKGMNPDSCDGKGETLLMAACYSGDLETVITLRNRGARKDLTDVYGKNAADWAEMGRRDTRLRILDLLGNYWEIPECLLRGPRE